MSFLARLMNRSGGAKLSPADFVARYDGDAPVIDVRTPKEFASGHLTNAKNADVMASDFAERIDAFGLSKDEPVYLYCRSGSHSRKATKILRKKGYANAINVGGYEALKKAGADVSA